MQSRDTPIPYPHLAAYAGDKFTIAVIPDSQQEVLREGDTRLSDRLKWLVRNRKDLNLKLVLHVGDLMNWDTPDHIQHARTIAPLPRSSRRQSAPFTPKM